MPRNSTRRSRSTGMVRIGGSARIPEILSQLGVEPEQVLIDAGFDPELFDNPDALMNFADRGCLFAHCARATGNPDFGLLVGMQNHLASLGLVGLLLKFLPDVGSALRAMQQYSHLHVSGAGISVDVEGGLTVFSYQLYSPAMEGADQTGAGAVASMVNMMRELCGPGWNPVEVWFMHRQPADLKTYRRFFKSRLCFDAGAYAVVFASSWLTHPLPSAEPEARRLIQNQIDLIPTNLAEDNFLLRVREVLRSAVTSGHSSEEDLAGLFSMHIRTFTRRLTESGASFRQLLDETRFDLARQLLNNSDRQISEIAEILHYSDARSFIRAFHRWSGTTPARWRRESGDVGMQQSR